MSKIYKEKKYIIEQKHCSDILRSAKFPIIAPGEMLPKALVGKKEIKPEGKLNTQIGSWVYELQK